MCVDREVIWTRTSYETQTESTMYKHSIVRLSIFRSGLNADEISKRLGIRPSPWGSSETWTLESPKDHTCGLASRIDALLDLLSPISDRLEAVAGTKLLTCVYYFSFDPQDSSTAYLNEWFRLTSQMMSRLSQLRIEFSHEIFLADEENVERILHSGAIAPPKHLRADALR